MTRQIVNATKHQRGVARSTARANVPSLRLLVEAESNTKVPAAGGFGYERSAFTVAVTSRSLSDEIAIHGLGGFRLA